MEDEKGCNTTLELSLGVGKSVTIPKREKIKSSMICLDLSFTLRPNQEVVHILDHQLGCPRVLNSMSLEEKEESANNDKRSDHSVNGNNTSCGRKKLRLTKEQSSLLEECFKVHNTLNPVHKQALAEQLNLKPRQVEVWFQNRRARTKLKQTEVDREFLEKCCQSLSDENKRLKKELQELRSTLKLRRSSPINAHVPKAAASLATCPSCEKMDDKSDQKSLTALQLRP